jgi:hypothetical protein
MENPNFLKARLDKIEQATDNIVAILKDLIDGCIELTTSSIDLTELDRQRLERHFDALKNLLLKQDFQDPANLAEFSNIVAVLETYRFKDDRFKKPIGELRNGIITLNTLKGW